MLLKNYFKKLKQGKRQNKFLYLAKNKLDCIEMLIIKSVEDGIIDHNEFKAIINEKKNYDSQENEGDKSKLSEAEIV